MSGKKTARSEAAIELGAATTTGSGITVRSAGFVYPHDLDAEVAVLAALLTDPTGDAYADVGGWLKGAHFFSGPNGTIYDAAVGVVAGGGKIDPITVSSYLRDRHQLVSVGDSKYIAELSATPPASTNIVDYAIIVAKKAKARALIARHQKAATEGLVAVDVDEWSAAALADLGKLDADGAVEIGTTGSEAIRKMLYELANPDKSPAIGSGHPTLDRTIGKMGQGHMILVASFSGCGKSAWATNVVTHVLFNETPEGLPSGVLVFSFEMKADEVTMRMTCSRSRTDSIRVKTSATPDGRAAPLTEDEYRHFVHTANEISTPRLVVVDNADTTMPQIRSHARRISAQFRRNGHPLRLIVLDYCQIISSGGAKRSGTREEEVAAIGRESKKMAHELNVPVILLSQLNNDAKSEKRAVTIHDVRESKSLLSEANAAFVIVNPAVAERGEQGIGTYDPELADNVEFKVGKRREGPPCVVRALYWPAYTLFSDV